jgi:pimeloyl-ACP methyl ester carboxylesterase
MVEKYPLALWPEAPSSYIVCAEDRTIRPEWSRKVAQSQLGVAPIELPGGHCPYISRPEELARVLLKLND